MSPRPRPSFAWIVLFVLAGCGDGCGGASRQAATAAETRLAPTPPPGLAAELAVDDLGGFLGSVASLTGPDAAAMVPNDPRAFVERWGALTDPVARHVPDATNARAVFLLRGESVKSAVAVRASLERDASHPLGVETPLVAGAPNGAKWVAARPAANTPAIALAGDVLVVADDEATLAATLPYLVEVAMASPAPDGLRVRLPAGVLGGPLRQALDARLERGMAEAMAGARAERARHEDAPALGEPEQLVALVRDPLRRWFAYLPDTGEVTIRVRSGAQGLEIEAAVAIADGTPLERAVREANAGAAFGLAALPAGTALAWTSRRGGPGGGVEAIAQLAGPRLGDADRRKLADAEGALATQRGDGSVVALGTGEDGPFLFVGAEPGTAALDTAKLRAALDVPFVATALGSVVGCTPRTNAGRAGDVTALCERERGPFPHLELARGEHGFAVAVTQRQAKSTTPHRDVRDFALGLPVGGAGALSSSPDIARALSGLDRDVLFAAVITPRALLPSLAFVDVAPLRQLAAAAPRQDALAAIVFAVRREEAGLRLSLRATPRLIPQVFALSILFAEMGG